MIRSEVTDLTTPSAASTRQPYRPNAQVAGYCDGYKCFVRHDKSFDSQPFSYIDSIPISAPILFLDDRPGYASALNS